MMQYKLFYKRKYDRNALLQCGDRSGCDGGLSSRGLSGGIYSGTKRTEESTGAPDAFYPSYVDQLHSSYHGAKGNTECDRRKSVASSFPEYGDRHDIRLSSVYDPAPVYNASSA